MYRGIIKRVIDVIISILVLLITSPVFILTTLLLSVTFNFKPFFTQQRPGQNGKIFLLVKFRTMTEKFDNRGRPLPDTLRLTKVGKLVRSLSIDELPQLFNVIIGDMSLVGPRPLLVEYLGRYSERQARRHEVRPGITGWAQVNGRNSIAWEKKFEFDIWYVENLSFRVDMIIILRTILNVVKREGINAAGAATMTPFKGNEKTD